MINQLFSAEFKEEAIHHIVEQGKPHFFEKRGRLIIRHLLIVLYPNSCVRKIWNASLRHQFTSQQLLPLTF